MGVSVLVLVGRGVLVHVPVGVGVGVFDGVLVDVLVGVGVLVGSAVSVSCSARVACRIACRVAVWRGAGETTKRDTGLACRVLILQLDVERMFAGSQRQHLDRA